MTSNLRNTVCLLALIGVFRVPALADGPDMPYTIQLGPGNEDAETQLRARVRSGSRRVKEDPAGPTTLDLSGKDFREARIDLQLDNVQHVNFDGADFTGATITESGFGYCSFRNARLRSLYADNAFGESCDLDGADITGSSVWLSEKQLASTQNYRNKVIHGVKLCRDLQDVSFAGFDLRDCVFAAGVEGCDFTDAEISGCTLQLTNAQLQSTRNYRERTLGTVRFRHCDFTNVDFSGHNLGYFMHCNLTGADLSDACLGVASPRIRSDLGYRKGGFMDCRVEPEQFYATRTYQSGSLEAKIGFVNMNLDGWDFSGLDLRGTFFPQCSLRNANLENAKGGVFTNAEGLTIKQVKSMWNFKNDQMREDGSFSLPPELAEQLAK